ncbi:MAG: TetM/TetW/TetO/TetS family tetracycline resistance ribosomal protection protein [Limnochordia bacterium]|nr:TetM/TetW/TetO/TetS family tetracycline resistance ribosomal protection protein [Limnochordia bacterium]
MKKLVIGILAHVDAGKTTLSESMLYLGGKTERLGRVDKKDAYLDTHDLERERGITIFSKQALFDVGNTAITLLDTPGHVDFSAEMERTLQVLDYAILVISGADGVQSHTMTLWRLLEMYRVPVLIFINKMDQPGTERDELIAELKTRLDSSCIAFDREDPDFLEELALCDERLMGAFLDTGEIGVSQVAQAVSERKVFPSFFGSALKLEGVELLMDSMEALTIEPSYPNTFGARAFKISRDEQGNRLVHLKVTGGQLRVRDAVSNGDWVEKVNQIRLYSGEKFEAVDSVEAGAICAVTGLAEGRAGDCLGVETGSRQPVLEPVLSYRVSLPEGLEDRVMLPRLRELEEEEPELRIVWDEQLQEIQAQIMGDVQIEVLQSLIQSRFGVEVSFDAGRVLFKETIANVVEGVGHFEPLKHYAEVHLLLEPGKVGSGLEYSLACSEDSLPRNWQRLVLTHLQEKDHKGVLTGSNITDLQITLVSGRAHNTHTEGGDFREATYRAVRQGLKEAESILLEPYYGFRLEVPETNVGRAITDIERMHGTWEIMEIGDQAAVLEGSAPVVTMRNYHKEIVSFTKGLGRLSLRLDGYKPCHNSGEVIAGIGYDSERDVENPTGSVFCYRGAGFYVPWDQVKNHMHVERHLRPKKDGHDAAREARHQLPGEELDHDDYRFLNTTANQGKKPGWNRRKMGVEQLPQQTEDSRRSEQKETYLLVDGYNVIHAWPLLKELADGQMDAARMRLLDVLSSYQGIKKCQIIVVFDAYGVPGHREEIEDYHNIHVVFTKQAQTADEYIEKFAYDYRKKYDIVVATSDALQQVIIRGAGSTLLSARELKEEVETAHDNARRSYEARQRIRRTSLEETVSSDVKKQMDDLV